MPGKTRSRSSAWPAGFPRGDACRPTGGSSARVLRRRRRSAGPPLGPRRPHPRRPHPRCPAGPAPRRLRRPGRHLRPRFFGISTCRGGGHRPAAAAGPRTRLGGTGGRRCAARRPGRPPGRASSSARSPTTTPAARPAPARAAHPAQPDRPATAASSPTGSPTLLGPARPQPDRGHRRSPPRWWPCTWRWRACAAASRSSRWPAGSTSTSLPDSTTDRRSASARSRPTAAATPSTPAPTATSAARAASLVLLKPLERALARRQHRVRRDPRQRGEQRRRHRRPDRPERRRPGRAVRAPARRPGVGAAEVQYVELHGTGTRIGDPIEAGRPRPRRCGAGRPPTGRCWSARPRPTSATWRAPPASPAC